jgi:hypothetical protein
LWKRGGDERRALAQLGETSWISIDGADPRWSEGELSAFAQRFDVLVFTEPHNLKGKQDREFFGAYVARLESAGWRRERAGSVDLARPGGASASCAVFTLRRVREE